MIFELPFVGWVLLFIFSLLYAHILVFIIAKTWFQVRLRYEIEFAARQVAIAKRAFLETLKEDRNEKR